MSEPTFRDKALAAREVAAQDQHGNYRVEFPDGTYATFVEGDSWALWHEEVTHVTADEVGANRAA